MRFNVMDPLFVRLTEATATVTLKLALEASLLRRLHHLKCAAIHNCGSACGCDAGIVAQSRLPAGIQCFGRPFRRWYQRCACVKRVLVINSRRNRCCWTPSAVKNLQEKHQVKCICGNAVIHWAVSDLKSAQFRSRTGALDAACPGCVDPPLRSWEHPTSAEPELRNGCVALHSR